MAMEFTTFSLNATGGVTLGSTSFFLIGGGEFITRLFYFLSRTETGAVMDWLATIFLSFLSITETGAVID
jgi:hypothetical protein